VSDLQDTLTGWLATWRPQTTVAVTEPVLLGGGSSKQNWAFDAVWSPTGGGDRISHQLILRQDAEQGVVSTSLAVEAELMDALAGTGCAVRDTRKTLPGLRQLEKYAVRCGGGLNHRMGLGDAALIKDNHVAAAGGVAPAIKAVRAAAPGLPLEVECDDLDQVREALDAGAGLILLDNMGLAALRAAVGLARGYPSVRLEASGGLRLDQARAVAETGVDFVAVGALTHSSAALDLGLDLL